MCFVTPAAKCFSVNGSKWREGREIEKILQKDHCRRYRFQGLVSRAYGLKEHRAKSGSSSHHEEYKTLASPFTSSVVNFPAFRVYHQPPSLDEVILLIHTSDRKTAQSRRRQVCGRLYRCNHGCTKYVLYTSLTLLAGIFESSRHCYVLSSCSPGEE